MRLAVFTTRYPARVSTFFERDMRALLEAGVELDVFPVFPLDPRLWEYGLDLLGADVLPRSRVHHIGFFESWWRASPWRGRGVGTMAHQAATVTASALGVGLAPLAKSLYVLPKAWAWAMERAGTYDHVLAYSGDYAATAAHLFHRLANRPIPLSLWLHAGTDLYQRPVYLEQKLGRADDLITCCEFNRAYIEERYRDRVPGIAQRIHVCYHGLDLRAFPFRPDSRPPARLLAVGPLARDKGFVNLLRAARVLWDRGYEPEVDVVGDGPERPTLERLAGTLGIAERVRFRGWVRFDEVRRAMSEATLLVHPSDRLGDGLPNVIREAMALGTPVIASRIAGIPEALDDGRCGVLVPPGNVPALVDALQDVLCDPGLRETMARRARQRTELEFDMWRNGARLAEHLGATRRLAPAQRMLALAHS
jgi:colanic acid/amylovoran biosynthesis glycosyltransferase